MMQVIKNELIKMYYSKKILGCCIFFIIILIAAIFSFNSQRGANGVARSKRYINSLKIEEASARSDDEKNKIKVKIDSVKQNIDEYSEMQNDSFNWKKKLTKIIGQLQNQNTNNLSDIEKEHLREDIAGDKYCINNNIKPSNAFSKTGLMFFSDYCNILDVLIFIIVVFMVANSVSSEYSKKTIKFLLTRPISQMQLILGKLFAGVLSMILIVTISDIIVYLIGGIFFGFSSLKTPIYMEPKFISSTMLNSEFDKYISVIPNSSTMIKFYDLLMQNWILQISFIAASVSFCTFISSILRNNTISIVIPITLYFFINVTAKSALFDNITPIISNFFMSLYDFPSIINRSFIENTGVTYINTFSAVGIMTLWSILFMFLALLSTLRKNNL